VLLDCGGDDPRGAFEATQEGGKGIVVGYNTLHKGTLWSELRAHSLPMWEGVMVTRIAKGTKAHGRIGSGRRCRKKSRWVVTVYDCTGQERVLRILSSQRKHIEA